MNARIQVNAPGVTATFDGARVRVSAREGDHLCVVLSRPTADGAWEVRSASGAVLGDLSQLQEAAVADAGLRPYIARLMRGATEAVKQVDGVPSPGDRWEYAEMRADAGEEVPLDALSEVGAEGWEVRDVFRRPADGALLRVLLARRLV